MPGLTSDRVGLFVAHGDVRSVAAVVQQYWRARGARLVSRDWEPLLAEPDDSRAWKGRLGYAIGPTSHGWTPVVDSTGLTADFMLCTELTQRLRCLVRYEALWADWGTLAREYPEGPARGPNLAPPSMPAYGEHPKSPEVRHLIFSKVAGYVPLPEPEGPGRMATAVILRKAIKDRDVDATLSAIRHSRGQERSGALVAIFNLDDVDLSTPDGARFCLDVYEHLGTSTELSSFQTMRVVEAAVTANEPDVARAALERLKPERSRYVTALRIAARLWRLRGLEEQAVLLEEAAMELLR